MEQETNSSLNDIHKHVKFLKSEILTFVIRPLSSNSESSW